MTCEVPPRLYGGFHSPILPIVLYTGQRRWEGLGTLTDLTRVPEELAGFLPRYDSVFLAAAQVPQESLTASGDPLGWLLRLLRRKFGPLPQDVEQRIHALTDIPRLDDLLDRILTAASIDKMRL